MTMPEFRFFYPVEVRYADIDAQRHVNNVTFFTYMESARARYMQQLGLWDGKDFLSIGIIVAEATCIYKAPAAYGHPLRVGVRTARLGTKSLEMHYGIQDADTGQEMASGRTIQVAYDYHSNQTIPVPEEWRRVIAAFERLTSGESGLSGQSAQIP
jgi:acyl-CoA thioester hydrolase